MARAVVALLIVAMAATAMATRKTWTGCNNNLDNPLNYNSDYKLPFPSDGETDYTPPRSFFIGNMDDTPYTPIQTLADGEFHAYEYVFADTVTMELSTDGTELVLHERDETSGVAHVIAGQPERLNEDMCNFKCHKGWKLGYPERPVQADTPPCDGDDAVFPPENTYRVKMTGVTNVDSIVIDGEPVTDKFDLPEFFSSPSGENLKLLIDDNDWCINSGIFNRDTNKCFCHSQCEDEDGHRGVDKELRAAIKAASQADYDETHTNEFREFTFIFKIADIIRQMFQRNGGGDRRRRDTGEPTGPKPNQDPTVIDDELACLMGDGTDSVKMDALAAQLEADIGEMIGGAKLLDVDVSFNSATKTITVYGNYSSNMLHVSEYDNDGDLVSWWNPSPAAFDGEPEMPNTLAVQLWRSVVDQLSSCALEEVKADMAALKTTCAASTPAAMYDAMTGLISAVSKHLDAIPEVGSGSGDGDGERRRRSVEVSAQDAADFITELLEAMVDYNSDPPMGVDSEGTPVPLPFEGIDLLEFDDQDVRDMVGDYQDALLEALAKEPSFDIAASVACVAGDFAELLMAKDQAMEEQDDFAKHSLQATEHTIKFIVGRYLPQGDINRMANARNAAPLAEFIAARLSGTPPIVSVDTSSFTFTVINEEFPGDDDRRRRAAEEADPTTSGMAHSPLQIELTYTILESPDCDEGDVSIECPLVPDSPIYNAVHGTLDDIVSVYEVVTAECYDLEEGNDLDCAVEVALRTLKANKKASTEEKEAAVRAALTEALSCASGLCTDQPDVQAELDDIIADASEQANSEASSSSSAGLPIAVVAGAAAGVILIVIIIIVVMRRRNREERPAKKSAAAADRTVVAFENPMYDDPAQAPAPIYDAAEGGIGAGEDEGLYDEPAFNADKNKENPMYQSNEDLAGAGAGGETEEGGYLDVAPDDEDDDE